MEISDIKQRLSILSVMQHLQYLPYGELFVSQRNSDEFDSRYKFTAKELDNETSYTYFGARYYDSELSVWLSVDPMSDKYPSLSPYCYTADNPVVLVDPRGMIDDWYMNEETGELYYNKNRSSQTTQYNNKTYTRI
ncbi:MAG: RHS repeat-associated core domain-containing protein, partial [Bacteroidales bacterium]